MAEPAYQNLPRSVADQAREADRIVADLVEQHKVDGEPVVVTELPPVVTVQTPAPEPIPAKESAPVAVLQAHFDPASATVEQLRQEFARLEQRYKSLQGKYQAEVPRYAGEVRTLKGELKSRDEEIATLKAQPAAGKPGASQAADPRLEHMKSNPSYAWLADEYGEATADHMLSLSRAMNETVDPKPRTTPTPDTDFQPTNPGTPTPTGDPASAHAGREAEVRSFVDTILGDGAFLAIDADPRFQAWLKEFDVREGMTRGAALTRRFTAGDIHRCAGFWTDWAEHNRAATQADPRAALVDQIAPSAVGAPIPTQAPTIHARDIDLFYREQALGKWKGREKEALQREQEIMAAVRDGRVIGV